MNSTIVFGTNRLLDALPSTESAHVLAAIRTGGAASAKHSL